MPPVLASQMAQGSPQGAAEPPPPGVFEDLGNRAQIYVDEDPDGVAYRRYRGYEPIIEALRDKGVRDDAMMSRADVWGIGVPGTESWDYRKIYDLARQNGVGDLKKDRAEYEASIAARPGYDRRRAATERSGRWWLDLPLGVVQSFQPEYGPLPALGLPSKTILGAAAREAAINTLFEGVEIGRTAQARETLGNPITAREAALRLGIAGAGGAAFGAAGKLVPRGIDAARGRFEALVAENWDRLPAGLRERWGSAANVDGAALPDVFEALVGRDNMSLQEKGAVALLRREAELDAVNPFRPDGAGVEAHNAAIARNVERVAAEIEGLRRPSVPAAAAGGDTAISSGVVRVPGQPGQVGYANDVYQYFRAKGVPDAVARGIAAGVHAESRSDHGVRGGYKGRALGLGQWLGPRRAKLIARYGENPTRRQQLDFMWEELQGGDPGGRAVLSAGDEVAALDAYIRKFMRPAAGAETTGDLSRGMQALGRGGETMRLADEGAARGAGEVDPEAAVRAELADRQRGIDADRAALEAERGADADRPGLEVQRALDLGEPVEVPPLPELRRDLFDDEESWRIAQAAVDAEVLGQAAPMITRQDYFEADRQAIAAAEAGGAAIEPGTPGTEKYGRIEVGQGDADGRLLIYHPNNRNVAPSYMWMEVNEAGVATISIDGIAARTAEAAGEAAQGANRFGAAALREAVDQVQRLFPDLVEIRGERITGAGAGRSQSVRLADRKRPAPSDEELLPLERFWSADDGPRDAGGLTAAERASIDYEAAGLKDFVDPAGMGVRSDLDGGVHDLRAAVDAGDPIAAVSFAARDGADETFADVVAAIDAEEAALAALRSCL